MERWPPSKRDMGTVYLVAVGVVFTAIVIRETLRSGVGSLEQFLILLLGYVLTVGLIWVGLWLFRSPLEDERVLLVSEWGALGIAVATAIVAAGVLFRFGFQATPGLFVTVVGAGGITGTVLGTVQALEAEHRELHHLYGRNQVLQRVLRHNIRNGMTVVQGYAELLEEDLDGTRGDMLRTIRQEAGSIVDLSERARNLQSVEQRNHRHSMDLRNVIEELLHGIERNYPSARVETDLPSNVHVLADNFIELALWEVLEYSIRHDADSSTTITVEEPNEVVRISITDPGGPISETALRALRRGSETQMEHLEGMELWVAKWLVENMEGQIEFERTEEGTTTTITLPAATPQGREQATMRTSFNAIIP